MSSPDSQWSLELNTKANLGGVKDTTASIKETSAETNKLTEATKRYNAAAAEEESISQIRSRELATLERGYRAEFAVKEKLRQQEAAGARADEARAAAAALKQNPSTAAVREYTRAVQQAEQDSLDPFIASSIASAAATEKNAVAAGKAAVNMRGMGQVVNRLASQLGGLSSIGRSLMNPMVISILAALAVFVKIRSAIKATTDELDRMGEELKKRDFLEAINARKEAIMQGAVATAVFRDRLEHLRDPETVWQKLLQSEIELLHERNSATNEVSNAQLGFDQEHIEHQQQLEQQRLQYRIQSGAITEAQYNQEKLQMDIKYEDEKARMEVAHEQARIVREKEMHQQELGLRTDAVVHAANQQVGLVRQAQDAQGAATAAKTTELTDQANLKLVQETKQKAQEALDEAAKQIQKEFGFRPGQTFESALEDASTVAGIDPNAYALTSKYDNANSAVAQATADERKLNPQRLEQDSVNAALAQSEAQRKGGYAEANAQRIVEMQDDIALMKKQFGIQDAGATAAGALKAGETFEKARARIGVEQVGGGYTGSDIENAALLQQRRSLSGKDPTHFKSLSNDENQWLDKLEQYLTSHGENNTRMLNLLARVAGKQTTEEQKLTALEALVKEVNSRHYDTQTH